MSVRNRPANRRPSVTHRLVWHTESAEHRFHVTIGYDASTLQPIEVFYGDGQKVGSQLQHTIEDACVLISLLLQHDVAPWDIEKSLSTTPTPQGTSPATVVGVVAAAVTAGVLT